MAATCHVRSNSFPSRPYPLAAQVDEQLSRLRSSEAASTSSSYVSRQLDGLQDLYDSLDHLLQLRLSQQALAHQQNKRTVEELLDGSLRLLDVCNIAKDALSQTKQSLNEIQSVLRRKRDLSNEVKKYLASRKTLRKSLQKVLKSLKANENKYNHDDALGMLKETEAATASVLESLLCFVSCSGMPQCKGSLITKLSQTLTISRASLQVHGFALSTILDVYIEIFENSIGVAIFADGASSAEDDRAS